MLFLPSLPHVVFVCVHHVGLSLVNSPIARILGQIVESLYSVKQVVPSRHMENTRIENLLDAFYLELPEYLKWDLSGDTTAHVPPPHVLTLNMQYWNTVLLLHRPL
jgi:hypothetical protein